MANQGSGVDFGKDGIINHANVQPDYIITVGTGTTFTMDNTSATSYCGYVVLGGTGTNITGVWGTADGNTDVVMTGDATDNLPVTVPATQIAIASLVIRQTVPGTTFTLPANLNIQSAYYGTWGGVTISSGT